MKAVLTLLAAINLVAQTPPLSPTAEFNLGPAHQKIRSRERAVRAYFAATPTGLTFISIRAGPINSSVLFTSAGLNGRILHSASNLASVHAQIYTALLRPDGCFWLVSYGRNLDNYLDLYSPAGKNLASVRLLTLPGVSESPIAAANDELVLLSAIHRQPSQLIHFGSVESNNFRQQSEVSVEPPVIGAIPLLAANGDLLLIEKTSGTIVVIQPATKSKSVVQLSRPVAVQAAAVEGDALFLLSKDEVLMYDLTGHLVSTYRFQFDPAFTPAAIAVAGSSINLTDQWGFVKQFRLN